MMTKIKNCTPSWPATRYMARRCGTATSSPVRTFIKLPPASRPARGGPKYFSLRRSKDDCCLR
ncbi:uncharacterized protein BYT42DRAFT_553059, partial [Radiomyces spectabilis]|uniref:uncharacterized protein n=1 Tax=Radiomyces spectabilis TaxID=64574 RepID=UPI002220020A